MFAPLVSTAWMGRDRFDGDAAPGASGEPSATGRLGMRVLLITLGVFFLAAMVFFHLLRSTSKQWPEAGSVRLPAGVWLSTVLLLLGSVTMHLAQRAARRRQPAALRAALLLTTVLGLGFLVSQVVNWTVMYASGLPVAANLFVGMFYLLTAMHLLHVLGGLAPLMWVTARVVLLRETRRHGTAVAFCAAYWHFLDGVWLAMVCGAFALG